MNAGEQTSKTWKYGRANQLRDNPTKGEAEMAKILRRFNEYGVHFNRSALLYGYIADFYCRSPWRKLVIEVDGSSHLTRATYDKQRDSALSRLGIRTLRFTNTEVLNRPEWVHGEVRNFLESQRPLRIAQRCVDDIPD